MNAYYNEIDPYAAQWLRNLIAAGHIAAGDVDERSILEVKPDDIRKYTQAHFFAGIGGWSRALRLAEWDDGRPVWTGSCPCQPFSVAGKAAAQKDERHLWPVWFRLIAAVRPGVVFGEQVAGAIAHGWLDDAFDDLEREGYETGAAVLPACSVGAPHKRDRLWFVGNSLKSTRQRYARGISGEEAQECGEGQQDGNFSKRSEYASASSGKGNVAHSVSLRESQSQGSIGEKWGRSGNSSEDVAYATGGGWQQGCEVARGVREGTPAPGQRSGFADSGNQDVANPISERGCSGFSEWENAEDVRQPSGGQEHGFWDVEPPLGRVANGIPARAHKLRAYGNAIVPQVAAEFIKAYRGCQP